MKNHRIPYLILCSLTLLAMVFGAVPGNSVRAQGGTLTLNPVADSYVNSSLGKREFRF